MRALKEKPVIKAKCEVCSSHYNTDVITLVLVDYIYNRSAEDEAGFRMTQYFTKCLLCSEEIRVRLNSDATKKYWNWYKRHGTNT